jgi:hypothetical protein
MFFRHEACPWFVFPDLVIVWRTDLLAGAIIPFIVPPGISPGFVNTIIGYFGLRTQSALRKATEARQGIKVSTP